MTTTSNQSFSNWVTHISDLVFLPLLPKYTSAAVVSTWSRLCFLRRNEIEFKYWSIICINVDNICNFDDDFFGVVYQIMIFIYQILMNKYVQYVISCIWDLQIRYTYKLKYLKRNNNNIVILLKNVSWLLIRDCDWTFHH